MANCSDRTSKKELNARVKFEKIINIYKQHPLPNGVLLRGQEYAKRIETELEVKGWTQSQLALEIGVSKQTITNLIRNISSKINLERLYAISAALECTPSYMVGLVENKSYHYHESSDENESSDPPKKWDPIIPVDMAIKKFQMVLRTATREDPLFVDYICQIVENKQIDRAKRIIEATDLAKPRDIPLEFLPSTWLTESQLYREAQKLKKILQQKETELCLQKVTLECLQKELIEMERLLRILRQNDEEG